MIDINNRVNPGSTIYTSIGALYIANSGPWKTPDKYAVIDMRNGGIVKFIPPTERYRELLESLHIRKVYSISELEEVTIRED